MNKSADTIIQALLLMVLLFCVLSFFFTPTYEKGAWMVAGILSNSLSGALGFKFGISTPKHDPPAEKELALDKPTL